MPQSSNTASGVSLSSCLTPIANPKSAVISPAKNGFVVQMQKVDKYRQDYAVATSVDEVTKIIADYFAA